MFIKRRKRNKKKSTPFPKTRTPMYRNIFFRKNNILGITPHGISVLRQLMEESWRFLEIV